MRSRWWRATPWWIATSASILGTLDVQSDPAGRMIGIVAVLVAIAGAVAAPLRIALLQLLAVSLFPHEGPLFGLLAVILLRVGRAGLFASDSAFRSYLLVGFTLSMLASVIFGALVIEFRPLQWLVWVATIGTSLLLIALASVRIGAAGVRQVKRFLTFALWLQVPATLAQLLRHGTFEPGDWFSGTWGNANLVGLWGSAYLACAMCRILVVPGTLGGKASLVPGTLSAFAALFLVWGASAKIYAASLLGAGGICAIVLAASVDRARGFATLRLVLFGGLVALSCMIAQSWILENAEAFFSNWSESERRIFLGRVTGDFAEHYNFLLGAGPGLLGSRAANAASADVLPKESPRITDRVLGPAPAAERWAMRGLWQTDAIDEVVNKSALVSMPFSGWGSIRGELGWPAAVFIAAFLLSLGRSLAALGREPDIGPVALVGAACCFAFPIMMYFDNILEQPQIVAPFAVLIMVARPYLRASRRVRVGENRRGLSPTP